MDRHPKLIVILLIHLTCFFLTQGKEVRYTFEISYVSGNPDGVWTNNILAVNGRFPGPLIEAEVGDTLRITVINKIHDGQNVTIHWHGIHQRGTPFEDGPSQITQCPIKVGSSQVYIFQVPIAGTYWYHSHVNSQYTEGLWGPMVIRDPLEVYRTKYDKEILITLTDWYHTSAHENEKWFITPKNKGVSPYPFSVLMNGFGRYPCNYAKRQTRQCDVSSQRRPVFNVLPGKIYRVRLINTSGWVTFNFTVEGHVFRTIEVDGVETYPSIRNPKQGVSIGPGQRYSLLINTLPTSKVSNGERFLIRANLRTEFLFTRPHNINPYPEAVINEVTGILQYSFKSSLSGTQLLSPTTELFDYTKSYQSVPWTSIEFLNEMELLPFDLLPVPVKVDKRVKLDITFRKDELGLIRGSFNGKPFKLTDSKPLLAKMISGERIPEKTFPIEIKYGDVVEVIINNPNEGPHPIHLHGHHFWVVGKGENGAGSYDPSKHELRLTGFRRDTILVNDRSWVVVRFKADNVGVWTLHCHVDWHNLSGMAMTFIEAPELAPSLKISLETKKICAEHGIEI